jgi:hypothetical protein
MTGFWAWNVKLRMRDDDQMDQDRKLGNMTGEVRTRGTLGPEDTGTDGPGSMTVRDHPFEPRGEWWSCCICGLSEASHVESVLHLPTAPPSPPTPPVDSQGAPQDALAKPSPPTCPHCGTSGHIQSLGNAQGWAWACGHTISEAGLNPFGGASRIGRCTCVAGKGTNPDCPAHP